MLFEKWASKPLRYEFNLLKYFVAYSAIRACVNGHHPQTWLLKESFAE